MTLMHLIRNKHMNVRRIFSFAVTIIAAPQLAAQPAKSVRVVDVKSADGTILKGTYFAAATPGPGVLLFHQSNRTRRSWDECAAQLAVINTPVLYVDNR